MPACSKMYVPCGNGLGSVPKKDSMKPLVWTGAEVCFGGTSMLAVFTGTNAGRSFTDSNLSHTDEDFPVVAVTRNPDPTAWVKAARSKGCNAAFSAWFGDELLVALFFFPVHAYKGPAAQAIAATMLCCNKRLLETDITLLHWSGSWEARLVPLERAGKQCGGSNTVP